VTLTDCRCSSIELPQTQMREVLFKDCKLDNANLRMAKLVNVRFTDCVLATAQFGAAQLDTVAFAGSDLRAADVSNVRCSQVDLRGARLDGLTGMASLKGAIIGVDQLLPLAPALAQALGISVRAAEED
jgi:uncharacterized protein YjbI with pentapeptide repeats